MGYGKVHEFEPDADSISFIDFEDDMPAEEGMAREAWHIDAASAVIGGCDLGPSAALAFVGILRTQGEMSAWTYISQQVQAAGFDVYESDSRFEVFEGGTPETYRADRTEDLRDAARAVVDAFADGPVEDEDIRPLVDALSDAIDRT